MPKYSVRGLSIKGKTMKTANAPIRQRANRLLITLFVLAAGAVPFFTARTRAATDAVVDMIIDLLKGTDNEMRMLALQQIREEVPGENATRRFVELLPELAPDVQTQFIDALGERGDASARPAIIEMLDSETKAIRAVAVRALSALAVPADVPRLARLAATGSDAEQEAARYSLRRLRGKEMDAAMIETLKTADPNSQVELMAALVDRKVREALPAALKNVDNSNPTVRLAALNALGALGNETHAAMLVERLKSATDASERRCAAVALRATCVRYRIKCEDAVIDGLDGADAATRLLIMRLLPLTAGPKSLNEIVAHLEDKDQAVRAEAVRLLADWRNTNAIPHLKNLARSTDNLKNHVFAIRGLVRLAGPREGRPADIAALSDAMKLATRKEEKTLVLGTLGMVPTLESLTLAAAALDQHDIVEDAGLTAVLIAEKISESNRNQVLTVMQKVLQTVQNKATRYRAEKVLQQPSQQEVTTVQ